MTIAWRVDHGDCLDLMAEMPAESVDAIVTDPPYGLGFMGKEWDRPDFTPGDSPMRRTARLDAVNAGASRQGGRQRYGADYQRRQARDARAFQDQATDWGEAMLRVLKPGGHLLIFGGTRMFHRMASAMEDAGFEIRDCIAWMYGSGFPKSRNLDGDWEGWGTALKPAWEPIIVCRRALAGTVAQTVAQHGTGAINIDGCRVGWRGEEDEREAKDKNRHADFGSGARENAVYGEDKRARGEDGNYDAEGRWPANVVLDAEAGAMLDAQSGESQSRTGKPRGADAGDGWGMTATGTEYSDQGGASRFYYCAKADTGERNAGLDHLPERTKPPWSSGDANPGTFQSEGSADTARNVHPTVKPIDLMRWLVRLVTPPGGIVLDPFTGSGTTGCAAVQEGFDFIGIEREAEYVQIARARIDHWEPQGWQMELIA